MFPPRRRVCCTLLTWLSGMAACFAQEASSPARSAWSTLFDGTPMVWGCIFIALIVTAALLIQLIFVLGKNRIDPPAFIDAFTHAIQAGNYQEAWETCRRWRQSALARMLQPALERIGQGREPAEVRLEEESRKELGNIRAQSWCMFGGAATAAAFCLAAIGLEMHSVTSAAPSPHAPRALALAVGDSVVLAAVAFAALVPAIALGMSLRTQATKLLRGAEEEGRRLIAMLPYEEIEGLRIGLDFNAGTMLGDAESTPSQRLHVSRELTTLCPSCNGPINSTRDACPHCGQLFTWS
jgi:hypothetical protein